MPQPKQRGMTACDPGLMPGRTVGAACAVGCVKAAAWTVSAGVTFCGKA